MSEELKLFGMTIQLPEIIPALATATADSSLYHDAFNQQPLHEEETSEEDDETEKDDFGGNLDDDVEDKMELLTGNELQDQNSDLVENEAIKGPPPVDDDHSTTKPSESEEEQHSGESNPEEKILKRPDKILPCPRCNSMETKFCYFNNYNMSQPRHFCKKCQRYWTAGGNMRNVPIGAGRRKNKSSIPHYRQISLSETNERTDYPNGIQQQPVLAFGSHTPLCESMTSVLNIADQDAMQNCLPNGFQKPEEPGVQVSYGAGDNGDDQKPCLPNLPCYPGAPWSYPWGYYPPGFSMPFYPAATYWGYAVAGSWNVPWAPPTGPYSPTLGKHSRDENEIMHRPPSSEEKPSRDSDPEKCLWVPKTLRIDDLGDAAKSSIWATLGIKHDSADSVGGSLFSAFPSKNGENNRFSENFTLLRANPAALSRSLKFNESLG